MNHLSSHRLHETLLVLLLLQFCAPLPVAAYDDIGGDDVTVMHHDYLQDMSMDIATNGDIYTAGDYSTIDGDELRIYRSADDGQSWQLWATLSNPVYGDQYGDPCLRVIEGTYSRVYVAFRRNVDGGDSEIRMVSSELGLASAVFGPEVTVLASPGTDFARPKFTSSVYDYSYFHIFLVAEGDDGGGTDIWFARSTEMGDTFEAGYEIASVVVPSVDYLRPDIAYGHGINVHVVWTYSSTDNLFTDAVRYRRAEHAANGGLSDWNALQLLTLTSSGVYEKAPRVQAGRATDEVVVAMERTTFTPPFAYYPQEPSVMVSTDQGVSFGTETIVADGPFDLAGLEEHPTSGEWILGGTRYTSAIHRADVSDLTAWSPPEDLGDIEYSTRNRYKPCLALNPDQTNRAALLWNDYGPDEPTEPHVMTFDAEWRADPGYPNYMDGFPLVLAAQPVSPPALVDVAGDSDLEIVFSDEAGLVHVLDHEGQYLPGWPVDLGDTPSDGPVAVGDLNNDGEMTVVAGTVGGVVHAYDPLGQELPGWPHDAEEGSPAYVSIGALNAYYPRIVVICSGAHIHFVGKSGLTPPDLIGWTYNPFEFIAPAAIGDIDGDGTAEVVVGIGSWVAAMQLSNPHQIDFFVDMGVDVSDAVTLGDLDGDGAMEILYPAVDGTLHALDGTGTSLGGFWPFVSPTGSPMTSAAIAHIINGSTPQVAVAAELFNVHLLNADGQERTGYPQSLGFGWYFYGAPIIGRTQSLYPEVLVGARTGDLYSWSPFGHLNTGWPKATDDRIRLSPAIGDLNNDGGNEVVVLNDSQLVVVEVLTGPADPTWVWPMYGHDPQRTGCADCEEDLTTGVPHDDDRTTRISFSGARPNPIQGGSTFVFYVPGLAEVSLEIFDLRGRRVANVYRGEHEAGESIVGWHGRDDDGEQLASGQYLAKLRVTGASEETTLTRKITVLR